MNSIKDYARYNLWANNQIAPYLEKLSIDQLKKEDLSSFGSIAATINHITWAEYLWYLRLKKESLKVANQFNSNEEGMIIKDFLRSSREFTNLVDGYTDDELIQNVTYSTMSGKSYRNRRVDMIHHCINHSTYHRGQLILMMRILGMGEVPSTDYITYLNLYKVES